MNHRIAPTPLSALLALCICLGSSQAEELPTLRTLAVGATPESVIHGFDGKLYVTLMGTKREKGDGDGKVVCVDGEKVTDFATGLDDPKGIVFAAGKLIIPDSKAGLLVFIPLP